MTGASLLTAATMITAAPVITAGGDPTAALRSVSSSYEMLSSQSNFGGGLLQVIETFLADHEAGVLAFAAKVPSFDIGPVAVGNAVLAHAYYDGFNGSATGLPGVIAYVESQLGLPGSVAASSSAATTSTSHPFEALILKLTAKIPEFSIGGVTIGGSLLADAYFNGFNGSATGVPGIIAYVKSQLGLPGTLSANTAATVSTSHPFEALILKLTAKIPSFAIGPVHLGGSVLANAYFNGYNGSATGVPGIIAYVKSQVGLPTSGASTAAKHTAATAAVASVPKPATAAVTVSVAAPKKAPTSAAATPKHPAAAATAAGHRK